MVNNLVSLEYHSKTDNSTLVKGKNFCNENFSFFCNYCPQKFCAHIIFNCSDLKTLLISFFAVINCLEKIFLQYQKYAVFCGELKNDEQNKNSETVIMLLNLIILWISPKTI